MNADSHWMGNGTRNFSEVEMKAFITHLWELFEKDTVVDDLKLFNALMATNGKFQSQQDRAFVMARML